MKIKLNYLPKENPIDNQDIKWLKYIWECSNGFDVIIDLDTIPSTLCETVVYSHLYVRFTYYKDVEQLFNDFEYREGDKTYYIVLTKGFVSILNGLIDQCNYNSYITDEPIQHIREKGDLVVNNTINHINNNGTFYGPVTNQAGNKNSNKQLMNPSPKSLKFNFRGMIFAILKKIPFIKDFVGSCVPNDAEE